MNLELAYYVVKYYSNFMTDAERRDNSHLTAVLKATMGREDSAAQAKAKKNKVFSRMLSNDPDVLALTWDGLQAFRERTAARILQVHSEDVLLNRCPRCDGLARTPTAKQCRFCGNNWRCA